MGKRRFASADTTRLALTEGDWIEAKNELSYGERQSLMATAYKMRRGADRPDEEIDWAGTNLKDLELWLVDWSFKDEDGKPVAVSADSIKALSIETALEIEAALKEHKARAEGNSPTTESPE